MSINSIEKRIARIQERLAPKNQPFLLSDLSAEEAAAHIERCKSACQIFFREFGGKPPVEPAHDLPIHEELEHWAQSSVDIFIAFLSALGHGDEKTLERGRALPELLPWLELAETSVNERRRLGIGL
jgi:hypothetical protein